MPPYNEQGYKKIKDIEEPDEEKITKLKKKVQFEEYDKPCEKSNEKWTSRMKLVAFVTFMVHFIVFGAIALIMPYFPIVAIDMGIKKSVVGFVFSVCPLTGMVVSLCVPSLFRVLGHRTLLCGGLTLAATAQFAFGFGTKVPPGTPFVVFSLGCRIVTALGGFCCYTTILSIASQEFPNNYGFVVGISEMFAGLGMAGAPALGGVIYKAGGYLWPTMAMGILMLANAFLLFMLFKDIEFEIPKAEKGLLRHAIKVIKLPGILIGVESALLGCLVLAVLEPIYAIFGRQIVHLDARGIGLLYTAVWVSYLLSSALVGSMADKSGKHLQMLFTGFVLNAVGFLLLGPTPLFDFLPVGTIWLAVIAEIIIGTGISFAFIPAMPYMVHSAKEGGMEFDMLTSGVISGMFSSVISLGAFLGPTAAGIIADLVNIRWNFSIIGFTMAGQAVLILLYSCCSYVCSSDEDEEKK